MIPAMLLAAFLDLASRLALFLLALLVSGPLLVLAGVGEVMEVCCE